MKRDSEELKWLGEISTANFTHIFLPADIPLT